MMDEIAENELLLGDIILEMEEFPPRTARLFVISNFPDMSVSVRQYDKFFTIVENNEDGQFFQAIGRNPTGNLSDNKLQVIDIGSVRDMSIWQQAVETMNYLTTGVAVDYVMNIDGDHEVIYIYNHIISLWNMTDELQSATIH